MRPQRLTVRPLDVIIERVLYESLSASRRARAHAQAATELENLYGEGADQIPTVLAHHLTGAGSERPP